MSEKGSIAFYKEQIDWYKRQLELSDRYLLFLNKEIKRSEKYNMDRYIRERSEEYRDRQKIRKTIKEYEKLISEKSAIRGVNITQKEITTIKKKAKECLELFDIKVPMTKMNILFSYIDTDCFLTTFYDVRTDDIIQCQYMNNRYTVYKHIKSTGKTLFFVKKGEEENND